MRKPIQWVVYGAYPDYDIVTCEWYDNPLEHYSRDTDPDQAKHDALEVWSGHVHGAKVTGIVRYDDAV